MYIHATKNGGYAKCGPAGSGLFFFKNKKYT